MRDPSAPVVGWQGGSLELILDGSDLRMEMDPGGGTEYFRVIVDGDHHNSVKLEVREGRGWYTLASGLEDGQHHIEVVRETYYWGNATVYRFELLGRGLGPTPTLPERRIEFYGDSNLAGSALESERDEGGGANNGSHFTLAGITARMFGATYQNISYSGAQIREIHALYDQVEWYDSSMKWDFSTHPADVVVVNLGANNVGQPVLRIQDEYIDFLTDLRSSHPDAHIVLFNGWGWDYAEPANDTDVVAEAFGDPNLSVQTFPWLFEQWHGCEYDHAGMAVVLAEHLESVMGWTAAEPDVMTGFGRDGDVANGSFEAVAPFGGYGWRYMDAVGVSRVTDGTAWDGDAYVRLSSGADIHQPNPARAAAQVEATVWLRGASDGDRAQLTIDFRDQRMWTEPLASTVQEVNLSTDWAAYSLSASAPQGTERPVFHTRLTIAAGADSTVDVDGVSMSMTEH